LAHLRRHFKKLIQLPGLNNQAIGNQFVTLIDEAFKNYSYLQQHQNLFEFLSWGSELKAKVEFHLSQWIARSGGEAGKLLRSLRDQAHQWWDFLDHPEVPPDNNLAE
jgi:transposase